MRKCIYKILGLQLVLVYCATAVPLSSRNIGCGGRDPVFQSRPKEEHYMTVDLWLNQCAPDLRSLRESEAFPLQPTKRAVVHSLLLLPGGTNYCSRITGYLQPPVTGYYLFTAAGTLHSEVWLSTDDVTNSSSHVTDPGNSRRIVEINNSRQSSYRVLLSSEKRFYFEILSCAKDHDKFRVLWLIPGEKDYSHITSQFMSPTTQQPYNTPSITLHAPSLPVITSTTPLLHVLQSPSRLEKCSITPSANTVSDVSVGQVDPFDFTDIRNIESIVLGNQILSSQVSHDLKEQIRAVYPEIGSVEHLRLYPEGLLWLEASTSSDDLHVGGWLGYQDNQLCNTEWQPSNDKSITMVVGAKGSLTPQIRSLLVNLQEIRSYSTEFNLDLVIVDFNQNERISSVVSQLGVDRVEVVKVNNSKFDRGIAMSIGALHAAPNSLLFLIDLHLQLPLDIAQTIWTHTIRGKSSFAPAVVKLNPNATPNNPNGYWDMGGFGLLSVHRSDFLRSGCTEREPTYRWGGEDHEIVNKLLKNNISVLRRRLPGLYHFHHKREY